MEKPATLTPTQIDRRAAYAALVKSLKPNANRFCTPINIGPLKVRRGTGVMGSL